MTDLPGNYIKAFAELAEATAPKCGSCFAAYACCTPEQCEDTAAFVQETFGVTLERQSGRLPFLGSKGCTVAPHLRPICSVHVCEKHLEDSAFADHYFELRERASDALEDIMSNSGK